jgi:predicted transcriptional regulator
MGTDDETELREAVAGIQAGLADAAEGRLQSLEEVFAEWRREFGIEAHPNRGKSY